jgi:2-furoyl-CoA dehydrogenase large subunit
MGLASRKLGVPVRWIEDRLEHLAASSSASGRVTRVEAGFTTEGELVALRYDAIEDVGAYVRAPEPATLYRMHGSLAGAYGVRDVAARNRVVLTNTMPSGLNRGFGGPQLYLALERTMTIAANRLGLDPAELRRRNLIAADAFPYRTPSGALYDSGDYGACLDDALELARYDDRRAEAETARRDGRLVGVGIACVVEPSISNMGYITLAEPGETRGLPKSGNAEGCTIAISPLGGITVRTTTTPQGQGHATVIAQVVADRLGVEPADVDVLTDTDTSTSPWTIASGNYSSRFSGVAVAAVAAAAEQLAAKIAAIRDHLDDQRRRRRRRRDRPRHGRGRDPRLRDRPRRRTPAQPAPRRRAGARRSRARGGIGALRAPRLRRERQSPDRVVHGLPRADGPGPPDAAHRTPRVAVAVPSARGEGAR